MQRLQWRLSTMFVVTTVVAAALAGYARLGALGVMSALVASWLGFVGVLALTLAVIDRSETSLLEIGVGILLAAAGIGMFLGIILHATTF